MLLLEKKLFISFNRFLKISFVQYSDFCLFGRLPYAGIVDMHVCATWSDFLEPSGEVNRLHLPINKPTKQTKFQLSRHFSTTKTIVFCVRMRRHRIKYRISVCISNIIWNNSYIQCVSKKLNSQSERNKNDSVETTRKICQPNGWKSYKCHVPDVFMRNYQFSKQAHVQQLDGMKQIEATQGRNREHNKGDYRTIVVEQIF